ncbi:hypothetical protein [Thermogemmatispora carboxidivorans]|uniref:hypothetical protein n=1 Tax=Thermogemmatispora carboxidivorans TaxID=1382306 RepID=UPI000699696E|nr:hypothetical protein [Thermogemmatispora carboxidivorans]
METSLPTSHWSKTLLETLVTGPDIGIRLLGGHAVQFHAARAQVPPSLLRQPGDLDLFTTSSQRRRAQQWLEELGLFPNKAFNVLHGRYRLMYFAQGEKVDIFIDEFQMCHRLAFSDRLALQPVTLPLADLLLTKLQIVELTEKDMRDALALMLAASWGTRDEAGMLNVSRIAALLARDWGLWKTVTTNLSLLRERAPLLVERNDALALVHDRLLQLQEAIESARKGWRWRWRAIIGERVRWYELPEEP